MLRNTPELFVDVVVDAPSDPRIPYFTYRVPRNLAKDILTGQSVLVPFGKKEVKGWVIDISKETLISQLKDIIDILYPIPVLLPNYIKLLKWMSWYYHAPTIDCLKLMLPEFSKKQLNDLATKQASNIKNTPQKLIIAPNLARLTKIIAGITDSKDIVIYHHELGQKEKFEAWKRIYLGEAKKIIGLRSAIFAPCHNLNEIKIIDEEDQTYFEERSPYYNLLAVAKELCQISGADLVLESKSPRIETFYRVKKFLKAKLKIPKTSEGKVPKCQIINMADEIRSGNRTPISDTLRYSLIENLRQKKTSLLFLNRLKESGQLFCLECKYSGYQPKPQELCPNCKGIYVKFYSLNLNKIAELVRGILPNAQTQFITSESQPKLQKHQPTVDITFATSAIFYTLYPTPYTLVGIISADTILNFPDYRSGERTFSIISQLIDLADEDGRVIIQTYNSEHPAIKFTVEQDYQSFYRQELKERKALGYPPFSIFAKLSICQKNQSLAEKKAQKLYNRLLLQVELKKGVEIFQPSPSTLLQKACYNIILRSKARSWLDPFLTVVPTEWKVEIEPKEHL